MHPLVRSCTRSRAPQENKRLQAQLAKAQIDVQRLTRIVENLATRTQILEANTGLA